MSVTEFSKKTGDYRSLSAIDLRLMALVYQMECEHGAKRGSDLRKEPVRANNAEAVSTPVATPPDYLFPWHPG